MTDVEEVIRLDRLVVNPNLQPRTDGLDPEHIKVLEAAAGEWPLLVAVRSDGTTTLVDGFHRYAAAQNLGLTEVRVRVLDPPVDGDLAAVAFALNAVHGRPLTLTDRRREAARLLRRAPETSDREIGRRCGLSQPTVAKVRTDLESSAQIERTETRVGRGGYTYDATARLGTSASDERWRLADYIGRLARTLERSNDFPAWTSAKDVAAIITEYFAAEYLDDLAGQLGNNAKDVLEVVKALGYRV